MTIAYYDTAQFEMQTGILLTKELAQELFAQETKHNISCISLSDQILCYDDESMTDVANDLIDKHRHNKKKSITKINDDFKIFLDVDVPFFKVKIKKRKTR